MKKTVLILLSCIIVSTLFAEPSSLSMVSNTSAYIPPSMGIGFNYGAFSALGVNYRYWMDRFGFQCTLLCLPGAMTLHTPKTNESFTYTYDFQFSIGAMYAPISGGNSVVFGQAYIAAQCSIVATRWNESGIWSELSPSILPGIVLGGELVFLEHLSVYFEFGAGINIPMHSGKPDFIIGPAFGAQWRF